MLPLNAIVANLMTQKGDILLGKWKASLPFLVTRESLSLSIRPAPPPGDHRRSGCHLQDAMSILLLLCSDHCLLLASPGKYRTIYVHISSSEYPCSICSKFLPYGALDSSEITLCLRDLSVISDFLNFQGDISSSNSSS